MYTLKCKRKFAAAIFHPGTDNLFRSPGWVSSLPSLSLFFFFPDVSLQLPWLTANSFITGHKRQVLHLKGRHPPSPLAWVKNRPAGIAHRTCRSISTKWRPAGPRRWAPTQRQQGRLRRSSLCSFIQRNFGRIQAETQRNLASWKTTILRTPATCSPTNSLKLQLNQLP